MKARGSASWLTPWLLVAACSSLPDFAAPKSGVASAELGDGDFILYRKLERADFKRKEPPGDVRHGKYELGAQTCAQLRTDPNVSIDLLSTQQPNGEVRHEGKLRSLRFYALMDRECSWWNPTNDEVDYTLEHEQIHFAISEIAARRLNRDAAKLVREFVVVGDTKEEVVKKIQAEVNELLEDHNEEALERNHDFDSETSLGKNVPRQKKWLEEVTRELRETEAWK